MGLCWLHRSNNPNAGVSNAALTVPHTKNVEAGHTGLSEMAVPYSVNVIRGMNGFFMVQLLLLMVRLMQRLKHGTVHELLLWLLGCGLPRQGGRGKSCASLNRKTL